MTRPSLRFLSPATVAVIVLLATAGCSSKNTHRLTTERFPANPEPATVILLAGEPVRPYVRIAHLNSFMNDSKSNAVKERQLRDLRVRAAELGADAVINIQHLEQLHRGMVADENVPFAAWRQGDKTTYFMRGTAVRYVIEEAPATGEEDFGTDRPAFAEDIPERSTSESRPATGDSTRRTGY